MKDKSKLNIIKKILFSILILIVYLCFLDNNISYAKYVYNFNENIICLTRDTRIAGYVINYSEKDTYTNQDVKVTVCFDKEIEYLEGFIKIDDYNFEKIFSENITYDYEFIDYSGNKSKINVSINNIDKELPKIIGIDDESNLKTPFKLDYSDNVGIKNVIVERYVENLDYRVLDDFYDDHTFYGLDVLDTSIKATIIGRPVGTEKYKYYLNGVLKGITDNITFEFNGLQALTEYIVKVEALNEDDIVIDSREKTVITQCFSNVEESKTNSLGVITFKGIYPIVNKVMVYIYSDENKNYVLSADIQYNVNRKEFTFVFNRETFPYTNIDYGYKLHFHFIDINGNIVSIVPYNLRFGVTANEFILNVKDVYNINKKGIYRIVVEDIAGNIFKKYITVN